MRLLSLFALLLAVSLSSTALLKAAEEGAGDDQKARFEAFQKLLTGAELRGQFTVDGKEGPPKEETYNITSVEKLEEGDYWLFKARIRYGDKDVTVPMPLEVKWAGSTPVITLDSFTIPGMGTFDARVLIDGDKYAGTWRHGEVGGLLYGVVGRAKAE